MFVGSTNTVAIVASVVAVFAAAVGVTMWSKALTMPSVDGFGGIPTGSGMPDCLRTSLEAGQIADFFIGKKDEVSDDLHEMILLLGKLACFKKDLMGVAGVVNATRSQPYATSHDIEPVAETTARCFAKTIPPRDLEIIFAKWEERGFGLLQSLCREYDASPSDNNGLKMKFSALLVDVKDVAAKVCFVGTPLIEGKEQGRVTQGFEPPSLIDLGPYKGRY